MSNTGQGLIRHFYIVFFKFCAYTRPRYQVSIYRTIGPGFILSSPEQKAHKELKVYQSSRCLFVRLCVCLSTLKRHWDGGKAAFSFGLDRIRTLVSMATDISHMVLMVKFL